MRLDISNQENFNEAIQQAVTVMRNGGVILYPTDTVYGLGVDSTNTIALEKLAKIKGTDSSKKLLNVIPDLEMGLKYAEINDQTVALASAFLPGPLALIVKTLPDTTFSGSDTIGIRIPNHKFSLRLAKQFDVPYTSTSANITGQPTQSSVDEILKQLGDKADLIDLIIDGGTLPISEPSTIVDVSGEEPVIVRSGAIGADKIHEILNSTNL